MDHSPSRHMSTPVRASTSSTALLVPLSIARPPMSSRSPSRLFGSNKQSTSTPENGRHGSTAHTYDAFMSPLKSAMKAYPVMSPRKKGRISTPPLQQCSNTSTGSHITDSDDADTTMASATASVLDGLFADDALHLENGDRAHGGTINSKEARGQQQQQQHESDSTAMDVTDAPLHHPSYPCSPTRDSVLHRTPENVTLNPAGSASKHREIPSGSSPRNEADGNVHCQREQLQVTHLVMAENATQTSPSPDLTTLAANIPLPPSPIKAAHLPEEALINSTGMITQMAADIPLPASPMVCQVLPQQQSRASPQKAATSIQSAPLCDRTIQAALVPLPQSAAPFPRLSIPCNATSDDYVCAAIAQNMPFANQEKVDTPTKMPSVTLHQVPSAISSAIPSPMKNQTAMIGASAASQNEQSVLPFAGVDSVDSPIKHTTGPNERVTLRHLPYSNEGSVPSPVKLHPPSVQPSPEIQDESMQTVTDSTESLSRLDESASNDDVSMTVREDISPAEASGVTTSEAGSPLQADAPETEPLVMHEPEPEHLIMHEPAADQSRVEHHPSTQPELAGNKISNSTTPVRIAEAANNEATPAAYISPSFTTETTIHAPAMKKRTLNRGTAEVSQQASSNMSDSWSSSSSSEVSAISHRRGEVQVEERTISLPTTSDIATGANSASRGLKRKASPMSIASQDDSRVDESTEDSSRRIMRQRSMTALMDEPSVNTNNQSNLQAPLGSSTSTTSILGKRKGRIIQEDEPENEAQADMDSSKITVARTRRQSTRLASSSGLPQPSSRIARKTRTTKAASSKARTSKPVDTKKNEGTERLKASSEEEDERVPVVSSRSVLKAPQGMAAGQTDIETPLAPSVRRPQRSARPERNAAVDAKSLPSPRRAVSPVKKPLRATRAVNGISGRTERDAKGKGIVTTAQSSEGSSARVACRSPGRVMLSPSKTNGQPLRSPGRVLSYQAAPNSPRQRAGSKFDWSSVTSQGQANAAAQSSQTLSPDRYRKTASKIFGSVSDSSIEQSSATSGPASSAASATGLTAHTSPFKGLAQRLTLSGSPSLLGISVAPELLVLAPPSPSPTKADDHRLDNTALSEPGPSILSISTSSAPENRRFSTPGQSTPSPRGVLATQSPRRALSAQPTGAIPRNELPSPRRVLPASRAVPSTSNIGAGGSRTPLRTASRVFTSLASRPLATLPIQTVASPAAIVPLPNDVQASSIEEAPRRSQRSARPQRAVQAIKKEAVTARMSTSARIQTDVKPSVTPAQLQSLTNSNTSANRKLYNKHKVTVIHRDEDRPPSPTSKIRKTGEEAASVVKLEALKGSKVVRDALAQATRTQQESNRSSSSIGGKRPHFSAPGDEGVYESPVKKARREEESNDVQDNARKTAKTLKWDRDLLKPSEKMYTPPGRGAEAKSKVPPRPAVKNKTLDLDQFGNVADCKASLSPIVPRAKVDISKIIYRDDGMDEEDD